MRFLVDEKELKDARLVALKVDYDFEKLLELERTMPSEYARIEFELSPTNLSIVQDAVEPLSITKFNHNIHTARIEYEGATIVSGRACLEESYIQGVSRCVLSIRPYVDAWLERASQTLIHQTPIDYEETLGGGAISSSWSGDKLVRFFPVARDIEPLDTKEGVTIVDVLSTKDYHPFIHLAGFIREVASQEGYTIISSFLEGEYFNSLYFSGNYPVQNTSSIRNRMDFMAGRTESVSATANNLGVVYADPTKSSYSVGNIVDQLAPKQTEDGVVLAEAFVNGNVLRMVDGALIFKPSRDVTMAFEYNLAYTTEYVIESRSHLKCFDSMRLHDGSLVNLDVVNPFTDMRDRSPLRNDFSYRIYVFDAYDDIFRLIASVNGVTTELVGFEGRTAMLTTEAADVIDDLQLQVFYDGNWVDYDGDWALYEGYVKERGEITIRTAIRSVPKLYEANRAVYFSDINFSGAESGMKFKLLEQTTLRPLFLEHPAQGSRLKWADISAHQLYQIDILRAVQQMYDLCFYTDNISKQIFIEPYGDIVCRDSVVDLSGCADRSKPVRIVEPGDGMAGRIELEYSNGDGYVSRWDSVNREHMGYWSTMLENRFSTTSLRRDKDIIFSPSMSLQNSIRYASSAWILQVGSRGHYGTQEDSWESVNFPIKIVRYLGMQPLENQERWNWPTNNQSYPLIAFHMKGSGSVESGNQSSGQMPENSNAEAVTNGFTLCMEDRDGLMGLHRYHLPRLDALNHSKIVEQYLFLEPDMIERLIYCNSMAKDWRSLYRISVEGESLLCRLLSIDGYDPLNEGSTKCRFIIEKSVL